MLFSLAQQYLGFAQLVDDLLRRVSFHNHWFPPFYDIVTGIVQEGRSLTSPNPMLLAQLYHSASELETIYSLLVVKNGHLVVEKYFNEGSVDQKNRLQSVPKSYTSPLVGIALQQGHLTGVELSGRQRLGPR